jgi:hypothetical protein
LEYLFNGVVVKEDKHVRRSIVTIYVEWEILESKNS